MKLAELQADFFTAIKSDDLTLENSSVLNMIKGTSVTAQNRIKLYRQSRLNNIKKALNAIFPVCAKVVGDEFFSTMAEVFINQQPPRVPDLNSYGDKFPDFIAQFPPAQSLAYLADVALLDFTWHQVFYGPDNTAGDLTKLAQAIAIKAHEINFALPAGAKLITSPYPIADIWEVCQPEYNAPIAVDFTKDENHLLIWQSQQIIRIEQLTKDEFSFLNLIKKELAFIQICEILLTERPTATPINELLLNLCQRGLIKEKITLC